MKQFSQDLYEDLLNTLKNLPDLKHPALKDPASVAEAVKQALIRLKGQFRDNPPADGQATINFFKYDKPRFYSEYIYTLERLTVESKKPVADEDIVEYFYMQELRHIKKFFDHYRFLYQYYQLDGTELDVFLFTPGKKQTKFVLPGWPNPDPALTAPGEFIFALFIAFERLQDHIMRILYPAAIGR